jgi:16S rRNA (guanine527-N7)-methyltransferase
MGRLKQGNDEKPAAGAVAEKTIGGVAVEWRLSQFFPDLPEVTMSKLKQYHDELCKFNKVLNLVSQKSLIHADALHFADAVMAFNLVRKNLKNDRPLYDIGSGNGFPGLVFGIMDPGLKVVLVDVDQRKCEFLKQTVTTLGLTNVTVECRNIERAADNSIFQAVMRGFAPLPRVMLMLRKSVEVGGCIYHLKSDEWSVEVSQVPTQLCSVWQPALVGDYMLPIINSKFFVVRTDKIQ